MMIDEKSYQKYKKLFEVIYLIFVGLVTLAFFLKRTEIDYEKYRMPLQWGMFVFGILVIVKILVEYTRLWDTEVVGLVLITALPIILCNAHISYPFIFEYALIIIGARGVDPKKIIRVFLYITMAMTVYTVYLCLDGQIINIITYRDYESTHKRMGLGFIYATCFSAHILAIVVCWSYLRLHIISWFEIVMIFISGPVTFYFTEARISSVCIILISIVLVIDKYFYGKNKFRIFEYKFVQFILTWFGTVLTILSILLGVMYVKGNPVWDKLEELSSERISQNYIGLHRYPITLLGHNISSVGELANGQRAVSDNYFVINNSYVSVLMKMGIIGLIAVLVMIALLSHKAIKEKQYSWLMIVTIISGFCFFEHRVLEWTINPIFVLLFAGEKVEYINLSGLKSKYDASNKIIKTLLHSLFFAVSIELLVFNYKSLTTYTSDSVSYADCVQDGNVKITDNDTLQALEGNLYLDANDIFTGTGLESFYMDINLFNMAEEYRCITDFKYELKVYDLYESDTEPIKTVTIDVDNPSTYYIPLKVWGAMQSLRFEFSFGNEYQFSINDFKFNAAKPFDVSYVRIIIAFAVFVSLYFAVSAVARKGKNDE